jgi:non-ribosomal peptide synthetase component F
VRKEESVRQLLGQVRERTLEGYEHQEVPFEKLVEELQPERDLSRQPLFQVMFGLQNMWLQGEGRGRLKLGGLELSAMKEKQEEVTAKFDLMLLVQESEEGLGGVLEYNRDLFDRESVERMVKRWERVLEQVVEDVERPIGRIVLLEEEERKSMEEGWKGAERGEEIGNERTSYTEMVAEEARRNPEARAVVEDGEELSYGEMNEEGNRWGGYLRKKGVRGGSRVGVQVGRWREGIVITLGVLKIGGVVVWLGEDEPEKRLEKIVRGSESELVITSSGSSRREAGEGLWKRLEEIGVKVLRLEEVR